MDECLLSLVFSSKPSQNDHLLLNHPDWLDNKTPDFMDVNSMLNLMGKNKKINGEGFTLPHQERCTSSKRCY